MPDMTPPCSGCNASYRQDL